MIHLAEIDRALRSPCEAFAEEIGNSCALKCGDFRPDVAVVQYTRFVD